MFWPLAILLTLPFGNMATMGGRAHEASVAVAVAVPQTVCDGKTIVLRGAATNDEDGAKTGQKVIVMRTDATDEDAPKVWIGVRLTAVPAPLAAHIGEGGVMIENIVKGSPADQAGLQRYDVVIGYAGDAVKEPQDLSTAVAKSMPGQAVKLTLVRKGARQETTIQPSGRASNVEWKYDEPDEAVIDSAVKLYGKALEKGKSGQWIMRDLGPLQALPGGLKDLRKFNLRIDPDADSNSNSDEDLDMHILRGLDGKSFGGTDNEQHVQVQVTVRAKDDGHQTTILTDANGQIEVTKVDAAGKSTTVTYSSPEELEQADPEAYGILDRHAVLPGGGSWWQAIPQHVKELGREFRVDVEKEVRDAVERAKEVAEKARQEAAAGDTSHKEKHVQRRVEIRKHGDNVTREKTRTLSLRIEDDGSVTVEQAEDGNKTVKKFSGTDDLKANDPELYAKLKNLLE
jgi:hypothetical protein